MNQSRISPRTVLAILLLLLCRMAHGQFFDDNFNRPDSPSANNGWLDATDNPPGSRLRIVSNRLATVSMSAAAVYRPFPTTNQVVLSAVITDQNGYFCGNFRLRYQVSFGIRNDGTIGGGYCISFNRGDQNYNSFVSISDNGVLIASLQASFQFGYSLSIDRVAFNPDGSIQGRIAGDGNSFEFSFPARTINSQGNNISIYIPDGTSCPNGIVSTVDNFQITQAPTLNLVPTNRLATILECGVGTIPTDNRLKVFTTNGVFETNGYIYQNQKTIVLTHGWKSNPDIWAKGMAAKLLENLGEPAPNIVAWDWHTTANGINPFLISQFTPGEGKALGKALIQVLGPNYNQSVHFIGHSLGTLVNSKAADYLHKDISLWLLLSRPATASGAYQPTNTHITLFDEAELAGENTAGIPNVAPILNVLRAEILGTPSPERLFYDQPLPKRKAWADNYVSFVGLFHDDAVNVVLTNKLDGLATSHSVAELVQTLTSLHGYPCEWYSNSVVNPSGSVMGNRWSFERGGFVGAPSLGSVFQQAYASSQLDLAPGNPLTIRINFAKRLSALSAGLGYTLIGEVKSGVAAVNGVVQGAVEEATANDPYALSTDVGDISSSWAVQFKLQTSKAGGASPLKSGGVHPADADGSSDNVPAYVWAKVTVPSNGVSMSFNFMLEGDGKDDLFAAAVDGTNVLSIETSLLSTNELMNSGLIDVAQWAGKEVELFFGIQGGTSTNAIVTVQSIRFYENAPPSLYAQASGNNFILTWPLSAQDFNLQSTTNLALTNSWTALTNVPAVVDLQNTVTNPISGGAKFFRLKK